MESGRSFSIYRNIKITRLIASSKEVCPQEVIMGSKIIEGILFLTRAGIAALFITIGVTVAIYSGGFNDVSLYIILLLSGLLFHVSINFIQLIICYEILITQFTEKFLASIDTEKLHKLLKGITVDFDKTKEDD
jgi:hypothetical protein